MVAQTFVSVNAQARMPVSLDAQAGMPVSLHAQAGMPVSLRLRLFSLLLASIIPAHAVFDVVVDDEVQLLVGEPVVLRQNRVDLVDDGLGFTNMKIHFFLLSPVCAVSYSFFRVLPEIT